MVQTPFDGRFKILAEDHPELLLRLFGMVEPGIPPEPIDLLRELHLDAVQVDHVYKIGNERMVHFEAVTRWKRSRVPRLALYRFLMQEKFQLPVSSYVVLMAEKHAPRNLPRRIVYSQADGFRIETPYHVVRLWELDASIAFEPGCEALLPWAPLLKGNNLEPAVAAIERRARHPEAAPYPIEVMVSNLAGLSTLRYHKDEIRNLVTRLQERIMLPIEIFEVSWLFKEGQAKGRQEGRQEATLDSLRHAVRLAAESRFPSVGPLKELDQVTSPQDLEALLRAAVQARSAQAVRVAIRKTAQSRSSR